MIFSRVISFATAWMGLVVLGVSADAAQILIDTKIYGSEEHAPDSYLDEQLIARDMLRSDLSAGLYDKFYIQLKGEDGGTIPVDAASFVAFSSRLQNEVLDSLMEFRTERFVTSYRATVDADTNPLETVRFFRHLSIDTRRLSGDIGAQYLLSSYARQWAYRLSTHNGPNCWHTAIASTNRNWSKHRYMNPSEYSCHLRTAYEQIDPETQELQFGDVISLDDHRGAPVHGFVYLGPDSRDEDRIIVFTKNGYMRSSFLFQDFDSVVNYIYPGNIVKYYRAQKAAPDPASVQDSFCEREYGYDFDEFLADQGASTFGFTRPDPLIAAGLRKFGAKVLPAVSRD